MKNNKSLILKVISWRACSISITLLTTYLWTGNIKEASGFTVCLHALLVTAHWIFEKLWDKYEVS